MAPASILLLAFDAALFLRVQAWEIEREMAQDRQSFDCIASTYSALVFVESAVQSPVETVLDCPVLHALALAKRSASADRLVREKRHSVET